MVKPTLLDTNGRGVFCQVGPMEVHNILAATHSFKFSPTLRNRGNRNTSNVHTGAHRGAVEACPT